MVGSTWEKSPLSYIRAKLARTKHAHLRSLIRTSILVNVYSRVAGDRCKRTAKALIRWRGPIGQSGHFAVRTTFGITVISNVTYHVNFLINTGIHGELCRSDRKKMILAILSIYRYRILPKYSGWQVWAHSLDPYSTLNFRNDRSRQTV